MTADEPQRPQKGAYAWQKAEYERRQREDARQDKTLAAAREKEKSAPDKEGSNRESKADRWLGYTPDHAKGATTRQIGEKDRDRDIDR